MTAHQLRWLHLALAVGWATVGTVVTIIWLAESVLWVGLLSVYALVVGHLASYAGARSEES